MVRPVINGPSLLETMMPTVSSDVTDGLSQTRVTFSAKPAPLDTPSSRPDAERQPGVHVSQMLCVAILRQPLLRRTFETHRPGTSQRAGCWSETSHMWFRDTAQQALTVCRTSRNAGESAQWISKDWESLRSEDSRSRLLTADPIAENP